MLDELALELEVQDKNLTAPRITPEDIDMLIIGEHYYVFPGTTVTVCCLVLENGFAVTGESACASLENFDESIGRKVAYSNAREKIWELEGYRLKELMYRGSVSCIDALTKAAREVV